MSVRWRRVLLAALFVELIPVALLGLLTVFGPSEREAARAFAETAGRWVGPLGAAIMAFVMARWAVRPLVDRQLLHGFLVGAVAAALNVGIVVLAEAPFEWLFVASNAGRVVAGMLGALAAIRSRWLVVA